MGPKWVIDEVTLSSSDDADDVGRLGLDVGKVDVVKIFRVVLVPIRA